MMACMATADDPTLTIDKTELEDAIWVGRAGVAAAMAREAGAPFLPPPHYAIAHTLFRWWLEEAGFGDTPLDFARDER
jgi:NAD+ diphosphatase